MVNYSIFIGVISMDHTDTPKRSKKTAFSDRYVVEVGYHKNLRPVIILAALPSFLFFATYHFLHGHPFPGTMFTLLAINAVVTLIWARKISSLFKAFSLSFRGRPVLPNT